MGLKGAEARWKRFDVAAVSLALLLGAVLRIAFALRAGLPAFDPWRHLQLVENLRAGRGFTLFDGQPYVWYSPVWYWIGALLPRGSGLMGMASLLSWLCIPLFYLWLRRSEGKAPRIGSAAGAFLIACFGPFVAFTCHYGSESFAVFLVLAGLLLAAATRGRWPAGAAGALFGVALAARMNLVFDLFLFAPAIRTRGRGVAFAAGAALPLAATWWRAHRAIEAHPYLFTWDGLATRSSDFNAFSTLVIQMHPAVKEGLRRLHEQIVPRPEWLSGPGGIAWGPLAFMVGAAVCLLLARRLHLLLAGGATVLYFVLLDGTGSSRFFRIWLGAFPVFFAAMAVVAERLGRRGRPGAAGAAVLVAAAVLSGAAFLVPPRMVPLEMVTPKSELLTEDAYMVNSGFYHPESLIHRFPEKRFVGMPLDPVQFEDFHARFPGYRAILWHDFDVQEGLLRYLLSTGGWKVVGSGTNSYGRNYAVVKKLSG
jgi:hypothetical protein